MSHEAGQHSRRLLLFLFNFLLLQSSTSKTVIIGGQKKIIVDLGERPVKQFDQKERIGELQYVLNLYERFVPQRFLVPHWPQRMMAYQPSSTETSPATQTSIENKRKLSTGPPLHRPMATPSLRCPLLVVSNHKNGPTGNWLFHS